MHQLALQLIALPLGCTQFGHISDDAKDPGFVAGFVEHRFDLTVDRAEGAVGTVDPKLWRSAGIALLTQG